MHRLHLPWSKMLFAGVASAGVSAGLMSCVSARSEAGPGGRAAASQDEVVPGLRVGDVAPGASVLDARGHTVDLASMYADGPVVVTFYRGGWCPFCTRALARWQAKLPELTAAGGNFVALTPERPDAAAATAAKTRATYAVFTDPAHEAAKAFKVHFTVDDATRKAYAGYGIDLAKNNGSGTWELPAPATFVIDRAGVVRWAFADWDYTKRADPDDVIAAVRALTGR